MRLKRSALVWHGYIEFRMTHLSAMARSTRKCQTWYRVWRLAIESYIYLVVKTSIYARGTPFCTRILSMNLQVIETYE